MSACLRCTTRVRRTAAFLKLHPIIDRTYGAEPMTEIDSATFTFSEIISGSPLAPLRRQLIERGFIYVTEHPISASLHENYLDATMNFFKNGSAQEKQALKPARKELRRGFSDLEAESTALVMNSGKYSDYSMCYSMGASNNLFPSRRFEAAWVDYFNVSNAFAINIARAILQHSGGLAPSVGDELDRCDPLLRFRYFPDVPEERVAEKEPMRMASHYDLSILTLIQQTPCANGFTSLQAHIGGEMVDLPAKREAILVLCGAVATLASNGALPAPRHHVASPPADKRIGSARTSSVFFLRPNPAFSFSVGEARGYGLDVSLKQERATFADWIGFNYVTMHTGI
jgi:isopenicillin N synthase-like dioxygenase